MLLHHLHKTAAMVLEDKTLNPLAIKFNQSMALYESDYIKNLLEKQDMDMEELQLSRDEMSEVADIVHLSYQWDAVIITLEMDPERRERFQSTIDLEYQCHERLEGNAKVGYT